LLAKGYEVHGVKRRSLSFNTGRIDHFYQDPHETNVRLHLHYGGMTDASNLIRIVQECPARADPSASRSECESGERRGICDPKVSSLSVADHDTIFGHFVDIAWENPINNSLDIWEDGLQ
jgi:hypothetical protein